MKLKEKKWIRFRIYLVASVFLLALATILGRAYQLQVLERDRLAAIARAGYSGVVNLPPMRGTIYDRRGNELAVSVEVGSVYAHPPQVEDKDLAARKLAGVLAVSESELKRLLEREVRFVWLSRKIPTEVAEQVRRLEIQGIGITSESSRFYPGKEIAGHVIGFSGMDNQGLEGLERAYDQYLKGPQKVLIQMRDAVGRPFFVSRPEPRVDSGQDRVMHDLVLTIDKNIQYKAQQVLQEAVRTAKAQSGQVVVVDPETGEILAMAVEPSFNPNVFGRYRPEQWRNRIITDVYEPGSTMKAFLIAAALDKSVVSPQTLFHCENGKLQVGRNVIRDTKPHGELTAAEVIALSSNIGSVKIGRKLGYETYSDYLKGFGFGKISGVDLLGERGGFIRSPAEAREIDRATAFFGQGMTVTSLQLAMAMGAIANGGRLMRPYVVREVRDPNGRVVMRNRPQVVRRVLSPERAEEVKLILSEVVSERGTAPRAVMPGYPAAGKTGTAQKVDPNTRQYSRSKYIALFVGFVPVEDTKLVCLVMVDEPKGSSYGGVVAAPVFREVSRWSLNHLRVMPAPRLASAEGKKGIRKLVTFELVKGGPVFQSEEMPAEPIEKTEPLLPDFLGKTMREVLSQGMALGVQIVPEGTGVAVEQVPEPGMGLSRVGKVRVRFQPPI